MVSPATIPTIEEKLRSRTEAVRTVALWHAAAHGTSAVGLAGAIARMFEDPSPAVQWHAMRTFLLVGAGAADAVPILAEQVRRGEPKMLVARALAALATVGPTARPELAIVLERWKSTSGSDRSSALEALLRIAPEDATVRTLLLEALYSEDYSVRSGANRFLAEAPADVVDWVLSDVQSKMADADRTVREAIANVLLSVATIRPAIVGELARSLLTRGGEPCVWPAVGAASKLPRPLPAPLLEAIVQVAASDDNANRQAMDLLSELGPDAARARSVFLAQLEAHADSVPMGGPDGRSSYVFQSAARALASVCPDAKEVVPVLLAWLSRISTIEWPKGKKPSWYPIGDVALAAATLAPTDNHVVEAILGVSETSRSWLDADQSGVRDFERKLRKIASRLGDSPELWQRLGALGIARIEQEDAPEGDDSADGQSELPDFPPEENPPEPPRVAPLPDEIFQAIAEVLSKGEEYAGIESGAVPEDVATAVNTTISRAHRERRELTNDHVMALGALWGKAVAQATGWTWAHVIQGEARWICLVSKDRAYAVAPLAFMKQQADRNHETTVLLLFNMIKAGNLPESKAEQLSFLG